MKSTNKNAFKLFGIVALAALIVFSMVACEDGVGGPGGGTGGGGGSSGDVGMLTITGLPDLSYDKWYAYVYPQGITISTIDDVVNHAYDDEAFARNYRNTFELSRSENLSVRWTGSGSRMVVLSYYISGNINDFYVATVNFSNGSATVPWSSFRQIY